MMTTMPWTAPEVARVEEPTVGEERALLEGYLEWQRSTLLWKCAGLEGGQLARQAVPPSNLSLLGLVRHMADVERTWARRRLRGEQVPNLYWRDDAPDADFDEVTSESAPADFARFTEEVVRARQAVAGVRLNEQFSWGDRPAHSVRWMFVHLIEEYARHNGHADLLRQSIDGATGY